MKGCVVVGRSGHVAVGWCRQLGRERGASGGSRGAGRDAHNSPHPTPPHPTRVAQHGVLAPGQQPELAVLAAVGGLPQRLYQRQRGRAALALALAALLVVVLGGQQHRITQRHLDVADLSCVVSE